MIPKIIFQTWRDHNLPKEWSGGPQSVINNMPGYEYHFMTDEGCRNFVKQHFPGFLSTFDSFEYNIQRADAIRPMWLYIHGGLYLDIKFKLHKSLHEYLKGDIVLIQSANIPSSYTNSLMASEPGNALWLDYIEEMKKPAPWWCISKHNKVMWTTGPGCLNRVISRYKGNITLLPMRYINPYTVCNSYYNEDSVMEKLGGGSWTTWETSVYNYCYCNCYLVISLSILIVVILLYIFKYW